MGISVEKREMKRPLGRPRRRWEDNIRMDLREVVWDGVEWIQQSSDRVQWRTVMYRVPCSTKRRGIS
jgi:hypothetical protein